MDGLFCYWESLVFLEDSIGEIFVQVQKFSFVPIIAAIPISLLITAVLYINQFPDYLADIFQ